MTLDNDFRAELAGLAARDRLRETRTFGGPDRVHPVGLDEKPLLSFASNDYLALSSHPALAAAAAAATSQAGLGSGAARLVSGGSVAHARLEADIAGFLGLPSALLFPTGYQTNIGVLTTLAGPADLIVSDAANHASIIDGCRLSRARIVIYAHADANAATAALATPGPYRRRILVTESLFSMDGDRAPLADLAEAATIHNAALVVDEAHALGVIGPSGRGLAAEIGILPDVLIGTLGKSFASLGGFAAGSPLLREILVNYSRQFIYSTACPPALAAVASAAIEVTCRSEGLDRRSRALTLANTLRARLAAHGIAATGQDLIIPIIIGSDRDALAMSAGLLANGILIPAIRPPTVPEGTARLRITVSAGHTPQDIDRLVAILATLVPRAKK